jgi:hypothetical protein
VIDSVTIPFLLDDPLADAVYTPSAEAIFIVTAKQVLMVYEDCPARSYRDLETGMCESCGGNSIVSEEKGRKDEKRG